VGKPLFTPAQWEEEAQKVRLCSDLADALGEADLVIEAVPEEVEIKRKVFAKIDGLAPREAILATNSSAIVSSRIADVTSRPEKVLNLHFFNPALVMKLVEVVQGPHVSDETARISMNLCESLEKMPVHVKKEVEGFLLNRIFGAIIHEAEWLLEMGVASYDDIDKACVYGAGHPMGPFRLQDLTGIDLGYTMALEAFKASGDRSLLPSPKLVEHYIKGEYGEKTGKGWYDYSEK